MGAPEKALALPLTEAQYGIWLGQQLDLANPSYWTAEAIELRGELDEVVLEQALREVLASCDTLHRRFASDLETVWQTPTSLEGWVLDRVDFSAESSPLQAAQVWMEAAISSPTNLTEGPLFQSKLLLLGPKHYIWFLAIHHIALDGYGYALLAQAAAARYTSLSFGVMVADYIATLRMIQPQGPYRLLGWSSGGAVAQAMAAQLSAEGEEVGLLALLDAFPCECWADKPPPTERDALEALLDVSGDESIDANGQPLPLEAILVLLCRPGSPLAGFDPSRITNLSAVTLHTMQLFFASKSQRFEGDLLLFLATQKPIDAPAWTSWKPWIGGAIHCIDVDCTHSSMTTPAPLEQIGLALAERLLPEKA